jgi:hypothetical protein
VSHLRPDSTAIFAESCIDFVNNGSAKLLKFEHSVVVSASDRNPVLKKSGFGSGT